MNVNAKIKDAGRKALLTYISLDQPESCLKAKFEQLEDKLFIILYIRIMVRGKIIYIIKPIAHIETLSMFEGALDNKLKHIHV